MADKHSDHDAKILDAFWTGYRLGRESLADRGGLIAGVAWWLLGVLSGGLLIVLM